MDHTENLRTKLNQIMNTILNLPDLPFRSHGHKKADPIIIASYMISLADLTLHNFTQSSTSQRIGASPNTDATAFSYAQVTIP